MNGLFKEALEVELYTKCNSTLSSLEIEEHQERFEISGKWFWNLEPEGVFYFKFALPKDGFDADEVLDRVIFQIQNTILFGIGK